MDWQFKAFLRNHFPKPSEETVKAVVSPPPQRFMLLASEAADILEANSKAEPGEIAGLRAKGRNVLAYQGSSALEMAELALRTPGLKPSVEKAARCVQRSHRRSRSLTET